MQLSEEEVAFMTIEQLSALLRSRRLTAVQLLQLYISRMKKYDPALLAVVTLTEAMAMQQAIAADAVFDAAAAHNVSETSLSPLLGIPYGLKVGVCNVTAI